MTRPECRFCIFGAIAVAAVASLAFALPGVPAWRSVGAYLAVLAVGIATYRALPGRTAAGMAVVTGVWLLLACGGIANIHLFTAVMGGTLSEPVLANPDSHLYYYMSKAVVAEKFSGTGYQLHTLVFAALMKVFGTTVLTLTVFNALAVLLTVVLAGYIASQSVAAPARGNRPQTVAMLMTGMVCYLLAMGTVILKDAFVMLSVATAAAIMVTAWTGSSRSRCWLLVTLMMLSVALAGAMRIQYIAVILPVVALLTRRRRLSLALLAVAVVAAIALVWGYETYRHAVADRPYMVVAGGESAAENTVFQIDSDHGVYSIFAHEYISAFPLWKRLLYIPLTASVQFFIPFFWTMGRDFPFGYTMAAAHFGFPWYALACFILYALLLRLRRLRGALLRLTLAGCFVWLVPAFTAAGLVSRYCLPAIPLLVPSAVEVWTCCRGCRSFRLFAAGYACVVVAALAVAYYMLHAS